MDNLYKNLYTATVKTMDDLNKALSMGFPESFIDELDDTIINAYLECIENNGKLDEFRDFAKIY